MIFNIFFLPVNRIIKVKYNKAFNKDPVNFLKKNLYDQEVYNSIFAELIEEMNINGKKYGSYLRGSFLGDDLSFCHEVTKSINLVILE